MGCLRDVKDLLHKDACQLAQLSVLDDLVDAYPAHGGRGHPPDRQDTQVLEPQCVPAGGSGAHAEMQSSYVHAAVEREEMVR